MSEREKLNKGGEGIWSIPNEVGERHQTDVLGKVKVKFEEGERPDRYDSKANEMDEEMKERAEGFVGEREYENRLELTRTEKQEFGRKVLELESF